jgi:hypothetical protein
MPYAAKWEHRKERERERERMCVLLHQIFFWLKSSDEP